ncbi:hypothetical protein GWI33_018861 [Rhynchophorus ferrugineus]|uniref:Uncharacterized protein n=1 Tax=Rhynchophorus ferrugineus TaxID=354439 RepID=A0A834M4R4_RHYFE|nr:hypothetical protein GWI33_018861 [Rhynchophorus ferrugineus]
MNSNPYKHELSNTPLSITANIECNASLLESNQDLQQGLYIQRSPHYLITMGHKSQGPFTTQSSSHPLIL